MSEKSKQLREASELRRSYRRFLPDSIDKETIEDWLMTASSAPSGANKQPWYFCVITDQKMKDRIRVAAEAVEETFYKEKLSHSWQKDLEKLSTDWSKPFLSEAPCLIVIFLEKYKVLQSGDKEKNYYVNESVGLATGMLINAVRHSGYQCLTYTPAPNTFLTRLFNRPEGESAVMVLVVGKGDPEFVLPELKKKTINEIASFY